VLVDLHDWSRRINLEDRHPYSPPVLVEFGDWLDWQAPSAPTSVSAAQGSTDVSLEWSASTDNFGVARYVVFRNGSLIGTSPTTSFTDTSPPVGLNAYTVYAEDEAGNRSPGSAPKAVTVVDMATPSGTLAFEVDATCNPGVAYVSLWLDGKLLRSKKGRILHLIWKPPAARCAGVYRFSARAYEPTGKGRVAATARNRSVRLPNAC
jgi:hypothetical protein